MKLEALRRLLPGIDAKDVEVNPTVVLEDYFARRTGPGSVARGYRKEAIEFSISNCIPLSSTTNNIYDMAEAFLSFHCPCGAAMRHEGGGGTATETTLRYRCLKCGNNGFLTFPVGGITLTFAEKTRAGNKEEKR